MSSLYWRTVDLESLMWWFNYLWSKGFVSAETAFTRRACWRCGDKFVSAAFQVFWACSKLNLWHQNLVFMSQYTNGDHFGRERLAQTRATFPVRVETVWQQDTSSSVMNTELFNVSLCSWMNVSCLNVCVFVWYLYYLFIVLTHFLHIYTSSQNFLSMLLLLVISF